MYIRSICKVNIISALFAVILIAISSCNAGEAPNDDQAANSRSDAVAQDRRISADISQAYLNAGKGFVATWNRLLALPEIKDSSVLDEDELATMFQDCAQTKVCIRSAEYPGIFFDERIPTLLFDKTRPVIQHYILLLCIKDPSYKSFIENSEYFADHDTSFASNRWSLKNCYNMLFSESSSNKCAGTACSLYKDKQFNMDHLPELAMSLYLANELDSGLDAISIYNDVTLKLEEYIYVGKLYIDMTFLSTDYIEYQN